MKPKWKLGKFITSRLKLYDEQEKRYSLFLKYKFPKGRTKQEDYEFFVNNRELIQNLIDNYAK